MLARTVPSTVLVALLAIPGRSAAQTEVRVESDVLYATHGGISLLLDAYVPAGGGPFPAVIVIPGGQWVDIDKTKHADVPSYFAEHGIAAFSIDYRSALEFPYPAAVEDVSAAIRWVRAHAADFEVNPSELGTVGVSAGGHLAALVAAMGTGPLDQGDRVSVVASWSGMMDLPPLVDSADDGMQSAVRTFLGCSDGEPCEDLAREASPITYVDATDPPMLLVNGSEEVVPVDQAESMASALNDVGVESHVRIAQGGHGAGYGGGRKILDEVLPFVQAWIVGQAAPSAVPSSAPQGDPEPGAGEGGKGGLAPAPAPSVSPVAPSAGSGKGVPGRALTEVAAGDRSVGAVVVAIAMVALLVVIAQQFVISRLRRRVAALGSGLAEDRGPPGVSVEGT
jgi:acetyl esterase/lipase